MDRWDRLLLNRETQRPVLLENEVELLLVPRVALYEGEVPVARYQEGSLTITNHRLLWRDALEPTKGSICLSLSLMERFTSKVREPVRHVKQPVALTSLFSLGRVPH